MKPSTRRTVATSLARRSFGWLGKLAMAAGVPNPSPRKPTGGIASGLEFLHFRRVEKTKSGWNA
ncbi:MAG: hypothetical protein WCD57_23375 [Acidobacteriaceae bacterium]